jgi:hypothetical protein
MTSTISLLIGHSSLMKYSPIVLFILAAVAHVAADPDPSTLNELSNKELAFKEVFEKQVGASYSERLQKLAASYRDALQKNLTSAAADARLEEAAAFKDEIEWL